MSTIINKVIIGGVTKIDLSNATAGSFEVIKDEKFYLPTGHFSNGRLVTDEDVSYVYATPTELKDASEVQDILGAGIAGDTYKYTGANGTINGHLYSQNAIYIVEETKADDALAKKDALIRNVNELLFQLDNGKTASEVKAGISELLDSYN